MRAAGHSVVAEVRTEPRKMLQVPRSAHGQGL